MLRIKDFKIKRTIKQMWKYPIREVVPRRMIIRIRRIKKEKSTPHEKSLG